MMQPDEIRVWIEERYGVLRATNASRMVFVAAVKVYGSIAFGLGSSEEAALADLYLDLRNEDCRDDVPAACTEWENTRRASRCREKFGKS